MRKVGLPIKIFSFLTLFLLYALLEISHAITSIVATKRAPKTTEQAVLNHKDAWDGEFKLQTPFMCLAIKGLARGIGFVYTSF